MSESNQELHPRITDEIISVVRELYRTQHIDREGVEGVLIHGNPICYEQCRTGERGFASKMLSRQAHAWDEAIKALEWIESGGGTGDGCHPANMRAVAREAIQKIHNAPLQKRHREE